MAEVNDVLWAGVNTDGSVNATQTPDNTKESTRGSSVLGKDAFLQLLVAQMKYQDPLNPSSDTEWIAQMATFSTLEEMQNMNTTLGNSQALSLVGKTVIVKVDNNLVGGKVDYVAMQAGKAYLSINESLYSIDDLDTVADHDYLKKLKEAGIIKGDIDPTDTEQILAALEVIYGEIGTVGDSVDKAASSIEKAADSITEAAGDIAGSVENVGNIISSSNADGSTGAAPEKTEDAEKVEGTEAEKAGQTEETTGEAESEEAVEGEESEQSEEVTDGTTTE